jgi:hypothetical protein
MLETTEAQSAKTPKGENPIPNEQGANIKKKNSTFETGHARNIANLHILISFIESYGPNYNPSKDALKLEQLMELKTLSNEMLEEVIQKNTNYNNIVNDRIITFHRLNEFSTRLINALETTDAPKEKIKNAKVFIRKMRGQRAGKIETAVDENTPAPVNISISQRSYNQQIQHFSALISILESESSYMPNESDLKLTALATKKESLTASNNAVPIAHAGVTRSRNNRDKTLYTQNTGLVDIALEVKKYVKAVFGASSIEYKNIQGIGFRNIRERS